MTIIGDALVDFNPWWKRELELEYKERDIYKKIQKFISLPQILAFTGLRRVGKTTLMLKIAEDYIKGGSDPRNVIYFSFDEFRDVKIRNIMKEYEELVEKDFRKEKHLLLLDEIQKLDDWENQLKAIYDLYKNVKIIISGSESLFLRKKYRETLAGRIFEFRIDPLSFREFLIFRNIKLKPPGLYEKDFKKEFDEFRLTLGFPELSNIKDKDIIKKYIQESIVDKVIYRDIPKLFKIRDISIIETILNIFMEDPGQIIELSELSKELKISRQSLSNYLRYLEESFLLRKLYNFSRNRRKVERKLKKYYPTMISANLIFKEDELSKSKAFEWFIINQLDAEFFWRDPYKNEVDAILIRKDIIPVEIKYGKIELDSMLKFMKDFKIRVGYIISLDKEDERKIDDKRIFIVPAFKFLLNSPDVAIQSQ